MSSAGSPLPSSVNVIRVFLASPNDLAEERRAARDAIVEINRTVARPAGFHIDLIGWEDTLSAAGRPQAIINEDLQSCQMFIGMLWARWGTPPDSAGRFTSGFEEEFTLSAERAENNNEIHMKLFFKDVEASKLRDPGPELQKVLDFKQRMIREKKFLFETFSEPTAFAQKLRISVADYINKINIKNEANNVVMSSSTRKDIEPKESSNVNSEASDSDIIEADFLRDFTDQVAVGKGFSVSSLQIARLRNLSFSLSNSENDQATIGVHDANVIYKNRLTVLLSSREINGLADAACEAVKSENVPLWSWIASRTKEFRFWLLYSTIYGSDARRVGVFRLMTYLRTPIEEDEFFKRDKIPEFWFGPNVSDFVRNSALDYLAEVGSTECIGLAENELARNDYSTRKSALDAILRLLGRESFQRAASYALATSFDEIGSDAANAVVNGLESLDDETLLGAMVHRSSLIREYSLKILQKRNKLSIEQLQTLFKDSAFNVRKAAVFAAESIGLNFEMNVLENIFLLKSTDVKVSGLADAVEFEAKSELTRRRRANWSKMSKIELEERMSTDPIQYEDYYFAQIIRQKFDRIESLRIDFDNRFENRWNDYLTCMMRAYGKGADQKELTTIFSRHQSFQRRQMMRSALDIICQKSEKTDIGRIRKALDDDAVTTEPSDIDYFYRWGEWEDLARVTKIATGFSINVAYGILSKSSTKRVASRAMLKIGDGRLRETLKSDFADELLAAIICSTPASKFRDLDEGIVSELLISDKEQVRKATSLKILESFS